jgi:hypothetical protein
MANVGTVEIRFSELDIFKKMLAALEQVKQSGHSTQWHNYKEEIKRYFHERCPACIAEKALEEALQWVSDMNSGEQVKE